MNDYRSIVATLLITCAVLGCSRVGTEGKAAAPKPITPASFNSANLPTVSFSAPDMMCPEGCGEKVKEILSSQPGAKEVVVDFDGKTATVAIEEGQFDSRAAVAALVDHGFKNSALKDGAASSSIPPEAGEVNADEAGDAKPQAASGAGGQ